MPTTQKDINRAAARYARACRDPEKYGPIDERERRQAYDDLQRVKAQKLIEEAQALLAGTGKERSS